MILRAEKIFDGAGDFLNARRNEFFTKRKIRRASFLIKFDAETLKQS